MKFAPWVRLLALGLATAPGPSWAAARAVYLDYEAPVASCPDRAAFWNEFWVRSSREGETPATLRVRIAEERGTFVGRVAIIDTTGGVVDRSVSASTCAEVSLALALISAIALHDIPSVTPAANPSASPKSSVAPAPVHREIEWSLAATLGIHRAVAPSGASTYGVAAGVRNGHSWAAPEAQLELMITGGRSATVGNDARLLGNAQFNWYGTRVTGCPVHLDVATTTVGPCVLFEVGALASKGVSSMGQVTKTGWWLAPGALLNWAWRPQPLHLRLAAGVVRPLVQDSFRFSPGPVVFRPPNWGALAEFAVGLSFN